jgi:hypothetical protein
VCIFILIACISDYFKLLKCLHIYIYIYIYIFSYTTLKKSYVSCTGI